MKTTIDKEFFKRWKNKNVAMWCEKEEYAKEFCRLMHENGFKWNDGESYLKETVWDTHKEETTYNFNEGLYDTRRFFKNEDYTILDFEDYIVKEKMTKQELVELLAENFINEQGTLDLSNLDFRTLNCDVNIGVMKVSGDLLQHCQRVQGNLHQDSQKVQGYLFQNEQEVDGKLFQSNQKVKKDLYQRNQEVDGELFQSEVSNGNQNTPKEKMTKQELIKLMIDDFTDKYGKLDLSDLDFTKYDCKVDISGMKVSGTLVQSNQKADDIFQDKQEVKGSLFQDRQKVGENLYQSLQKVQGHLFQHCQIVQGSLYQGGQKVERNLLQSEQEVGGSLFQDGQKAQGGLYQDELKTKKNKDEEIKQASNGGLLTKEMLVKLLVENFVNEYGELDLSDLDFSGYDLDVDISGIKTRGDIYQGEHTTKGYIHQGHHITNKDIYQSDHITKGSIYQLRNKAGGELYQEI